MEKYIHGRSGRVAFPRTKVVPAAKPARFEVGAAARIAERRAVVRRRVEFIIASVGEKSIGKDCVDVDVQLVVVVVVM